MKKKLLIIEDEPSVAKQLKWGLGKKYNITIAKDVRQAKKFLASRVFPVATLDLGLAPFPDSPEQGFELLKNLPGLSPHTRIVIITGNAEQENAIRAIGLGASDFCAKPVDLHVLRIILERTFRLHELEEANRKLRSVTEESGGSLCGMIGASPVMKKVFNAISQMAVTDYPVLITGSTGTGKEMAAHAVHSLSLRSEGPFIIVNCGAIPENLIESELFGHEKGAFTGAVSRKTGKFEQADGGTIFLDEIGELPLPMQVKLLRVLQESTIERVGGSKTITLDVRIVAATNIKLEAAYRQGTFRQDLFFRLNVVPLALPDLSDRSEDILLLAHYFLEQEAGRLGRGKITFAPSALSAMSAHDWPGNVRELQNRIRRALGTGAHCAALSSVDLGFDIEEFNGVEKIITLREARAEAEQMAVNRALAFTGNNISQAARLLQISRPTLHDLLKKHGICTAK